MNNKIIIATSMVALMLVAPVARADVCKSAAECTSDGLLKLGKRLLGTTLIVTSGLAEAGREYIDGGNVGEVIGAGIVGAGKRLVETVKETVDDTKVITEATLDAAGKVYDWAQEK